MNAFFPDVSETVKPRAHAAGSDVIMANTHDSSERLVRPRLSKSTWASTVRSEPPSRAS